VDADAVKPVPLVEPKTLEPNTLSVAPLLPALPKVGVELPKAGVGLPKVGAVGVEKAAKPVVLLPKSELVGDFAAVAPLPKTGITEAAVFPNVGKALPAPDPDPDPGPKSSFTFLTAKASLS
jgi:hypothetical protein